MNAAEVTADPQESLKYRVILYSLLTIFWLSGATPWIVELASESLSFSLIKIYQIIADIMMVVFGLMTIRKKGDIWVAVSFVVISFVSTCLFNKLSLIFWLNGMRYYLPFIFLYPIFRYLCSTRYQAAKLFAIVDKAIYIFLWLQVPALVLQFVLHGAGDEGGGTLGNLNSGTITTLIYSISFYIMMRKWDYSLSYWENIKRNYVPVLLTFTTMLNETKIAFVFMFLYFILFLPLNRKFMRNMFILSPVVLVVIAVGGYLYSSATGGDTAAGITDPEFIEFYLVGDDHMLDLLEYYFDEGIDEGNEGDYPRGLKFAAIRFVIDDEPWGPLLGFGIGQFKGGSFLEISDFHKRYKWLLEGTQMMLMVWMLDLGIVGVIWAAFSMGNIFGWFRKKPYRNKQLLVFMTFIFIISAIYNSNFMSYPFCFIAFFLAYAQRHWNMTRFAEEYSANKAIQ